MSAHPRVLMAVILVIFAGAIGAVWLAAATNDRQREGTAVAACERGNVIREYLAFDNAETISVLKGSLRVVPATAHGAYVETRRRSLEQREAYQLGLVPYECQSLR